jgi:hypothetical protein
MFRAVHRSSSGALTVFAASGLHTVWRWLGSVNAQNTVHYDLRSHDGYPDQWKHWVHGKWSVGPLETCWAFIERWNNKFCYKVASCWLFLLNHTTMHGSINIKSPVEGRIMDCHTDLRHRVAQKHKTFRNSILLSSLFVLLLIFFHHHHPSFSSSLLWCSPCIRHPRNPGVREPRSRVTIPAWVSDICASAFVLPCDSRAVIFALQEYPHHSPSTYIEHKPSYEFSSRSISEVFI